MAHLRVPTYSLYGDLAGTLLDEPFHCESIAARSRLHGWEIGPHRHDAFFQLLHVSAGGGSAHFDGGRAPIVPPCILVVPTMAVHGFAFDPDTDGRVVTVVDRHLESLLGGARDALRRLTAAPRIVRLDEAGAATFGALLDAFAHEHAGTARWRAETLQAMLSVALLRVARLLADDETPADGSPDRALRHVHRFRALVDRHFRERRTIGDYAADLGITATQLNRVCRRVTGRSALDVIADRRILEAARDLLYTTLEIKAIALGLGFDDAAYFSRFFTRRTGRTPGAFRAAASAALTQPGGSRPPPAGAG